MEEEESGLMKSSLLVPATGNHEEGDSVEGVVDFRGSPAIRSRTGRWRSALFIIGVEISERLAYYGISSNLITYLTEYIGQSTATAAENINIWAGFASLLPLVGAFVADSYLGRYRTILCASLLYVLGLACLTISAILPLGCGEDSSSSSCSPEFQVGVFFSSLYLVAIAQSGHKPCVQAFGADQFDESNPKEQKLRASFFNWWYFSMCCGIVVFVSVIVYIQDNMGWGLGFGIPCLSMVFALAVFLLGTSTYRFNVVQKGNPFIRIGRVFLAASQKWNWPVEESEHPSVSRKFSFLDRAALNVKSDSSPPLKSSKIVCTETEVEEAKGVLRLVPIWFTCLMYAVVFAQSSTLFTKQGSTMERNITSSFVVPAAMLQSFISITIVLFIPVYDQILVPVTRSFTGLSSGITMLQRIGIGLLLSIISMVVSAIVESRRLEVAKDAGLIDLPSATVPMSICWLIPQFLLFGVADVFTMVGLQEFFYDQVPDVLRSLGIALYLSIFGIGSFLSSFLIYMVEKLSTINGEDWFSNNLNRAHLDYFYWLLAGLSVVALFLYVFFAKSYVYKKHTVCCSSTQ